MSVKKWLKDAGVNTIIIDTDSRGALLYRVDTRWGHGTIGSREAGNNPTLRQIVAAFYRETVAECERILANPDTSDSLRSAVQNRIAAISSVLATLKEAL
jgi:hypothetical protein